MDKKKLINGILLVNVIILIAAWAFGGWLCLLSWILVATSFYFVGKLQNEKAKI